MATKIRVLIANNNQESIISIRKLLEASKGFTITGEAKNGEDAVEMTLSFQPDIVVMDTNMPGTDGFLAATQIAREAPHIGIILVGTAESIDIVRHGMQSGAGDFLELPLSASKLQNAVASLYTIKQEQRRHLAENPLIIPQRQPKIISVFSSKGGVGKSVLAANVAVVIREETREDVLLADMDLQFGDIADMFNISNKTSIVDLLADKENLESGITEKYFVLHSSGVKILPAPQQPEQADLVDETDVRELLMLLRKKFDYIVVDLPPLFNEVTLRTIEMSDHLLMVTTMEIPTLKNIKGGLEILQKVDYAPEKITLILNRFHDKREIKTEDVKEFLGVRELFKIDDASEMVSKSINLGEPLVIGYRDTPVARQILRLGRKLIDYKSISYRGGKEFFKWKAFGRR